MIRYITCEQISEMVRNLCIDANKHLTADICEALCRAEGEETSPLGKSILGDMIRNNTAAEELDIPVCQDTGMAVVFAEIGQQAVITGGAFEDAVNEGVRRGYTEGLLRCSVVSDPLERVNSGDNTPAVIHARLVPGNSVKITVAPKGFGSENMSKLKMLTPAATREDLIQTVVDIVRQAGSNPCPPMIIGVGIGGDFEYSALLAKKAVCRPIDQPNPDPVYARLEEDMLRAVNETGIGAQGFGGKTTALGLNIEKYATHIAGLPVAVNIGCYVTRHKTAVI